MNTGRQSGYANVRKDAYDDLVHQLNAATTNIWLYRTPYSIIADPQVHGLRQGEGGRLRQLPAEDLVGRPLAGHELIDRAAGPAIDSDVDVT